MSLFQCSKCGCVENTACCNYWWNTSEGLPAECSACDSEIGKWHGKFSRTFLPIGMFKTTKNGNIEHIETGDQDFKKYAIERTE